MWILESRTPEDTWTLGCRLGEVAGEPLVVALVGDLGCGKTCLAQGIGAGLDIDQEILSPTFVLVNEYEGRQPLLHADVYRLKESELEAIGLEEQLEAWPGLALVEWADRFEELLPGDHLRVLIEDRGSTLRRLTLEARGPRAEAHLSRVRAAWEKAHRD